MIDRRLRRVLLAIAIPAATIALAGSPALAQSSGGANSAATMSNQMPAVTPGQTGTGTTPSGRASKRPAPVVAHKVHAKPGQSKVITPH